MDYSSFSCFSDDSPWQHKIFFTTSLHVASLMWKITLTLVSPQSTFPALKDFPNCLLHIPTPRVQPWWTLWSQEEVCKVSCAGAFVSLSCPLSPY